jgi:hypothetical protein
MVAEKVQDFAYFMQCLIEATTRVEAHYFKVEVAGLAGSAFRERAYCSRATADDASLSGSRRRVAAPYA